MTLVTSTVCSVRLCSLRKFRALSVHKALTLLVVFALSAVATPHSSFLFSLLVLSSVLSQLVILPTLSVASGPSSQAASFTSLVSSSKSFACSRTISVANTITGVILQIAASGRDLLVAGRAISGIGVGFESAIVILYMSEICPKKVRGALVSGYQFCITIGLLLAACVNYAVKGRGDTGEYRIPIGIQFAWGIILATGVACLPDSPRYFIKRGKTVEAKKALMKVRGVHPTNPDSEHLRAMVEFELAEIIANEEYEREQTPAGGWLAGWTNCFKGSLFQSNSNLRKTILGTSLQMMQQWTGVNFIFYYSTPFLQSTGAISNTFLISLIFTLVNVCSTPLSFYGMEKFGRRTLLLYGAFGMLICQFLVAIIGVTVGFNKSITLADGTTRAENLSAVNAQIAFIAIFIFCFATTWGPGAWVLIGEVFPLPIRSRGVALSTASNWLWNTIISVITP